ncbi:MAG: hypothetical protein MZV63_47310 [Marinilabiliales bacterium]|nr:hypothetical protein [Marinilabiliales bacterium]
MHSRQRIILRALKLLTDSSRKETAISIIILIVRSFLPLIALFLVRYYVDRITGADAEAAASSPYHGHRAYPGHGTHPA